MPSAEDELADLRAENARLKQEAENARMKAELARLRSENAQLRGGRGGAAPATNDLNTMPPPEKSMQRTTINKKEVAGLDMQRATIGPKEVAGLYISCCGPFPGCRMFMVRDDRGEDALDGCFCCCCLVPIQKEFHRAPVENSSSSPNWFKGWESQLTLHRDQWRQTHRANRRLHFDNKCCNHETLPGTNLPCMCAIKIIPF